MEITTYLRILWRRKWSILLVTVCAIGAVYIGLSQITPTYTTATKLRITTARSGAQDFLQYDIFYADRLMNTYAAIARTGPIVEEMMQRLQLDIIPDITVSVIANTEVLEIAVTHPDPVSASEIANMLARVLVERSAELTGTALIPSEEETTGAAALQVTTVSVIEEAWIPDAPSHPNKRLFLLLGGMVGLLGGVGLAFLFESFDTRLRYEDQISVITGQPILGQIPIAEKRQRKQFLAAIYPHSESFGHLRTQLFALAREAPFKTMLITSAEPSEGKSTILANLAFTVAQTGRRVLVIDADMRLPTLHLLFGVENGAGLSQLLQDNAVLAADVIQNSIFPNIDIIPSGPIPLNPSELLTSDRTAGLLSELSEEYVLVLVDAPAFLPVTDAGILAQLVDGVVLVVALASTSTQAVRSTCMQLANFQARLIGTIVNKSKPLLFDDYYFQQHARPTRRKGGFFGKFIPWHTGFALIRNARRRQTKTTPRHITHLAAQTTIKTNQAITWGTRNTPPYSAWRRS